MSLKQYLIFMSATTLVAYLALLGVVLYFDPFVSTLAVIFFYASLGLSLLGSFSILGFLARYFFADSKVAFKEVLIAFRQAIWLSLLIVVSLYLRSKGLFNFFSVITLIFSLSVLELFFLTNKKQKRI